MLLDSLFCMSIVIKNHQEVKGKVGNLSKNLSVFMKTKGVSESDLSRILNVPYNTIKRLINGSTTDPRASTLTLIANYFSVSVDQLLGKQPLFSNNNQKIIADVNKSLPILHWKDVQNWEKTIDLLKTKNHLDWITLDSNEKGSFALKVFGESMWPQFQENTILIIDPTRAVKNRDFVVVYIKKNKEIVFRQLIIDGTYKLLKAVNTIFPIIEIDPSDKIIGVVIQTRNCYD